jgi:mono/diheme cytochrome c family protein
MKALRIVLPAVVVLALGTVAWFARGGETFKPGKLSKQEQAALQPGLTLRLFRKDTADKPLDARRVRLAALHVNAGTAPSPFVAPGQFAATISGYLKTSLKGEFIFRVDSIGTATLRINGKEVLKVVNRVQDTAEPIQLAKGYNRIELDYVSTAKGDGHVRVYWSGENFTTEPLPPELLFARGDEADLIRGEELRAGRFLYATRGCARCHALPDNIKEGELAMPELRFQRAPSLEGAGRRLEPAWMARWALDTRSLRPEARMPHVLRGDSAQQQAADVAAYLAGLQDGPALAATASTGELIASGEKFFDKLGCVACHRLEDPRKEDSLGRLSLFYVKAKFRPGALEAFLRAPHQYYPWTRMPDFHLDANEAAALAAFLRDRAKGTPELVALKADVTRGANLFERAGCANCHVVKAGASAPSKLLPSPAADALSRGCLALAPNQAPDFGLKEGERKALRAFLKAGGDSLGRQTPAEFSLRQVKELQCQSCHRRDGQNSRWNQYLEDEGLMQEFLPSLTWAGEKLQPAWTVKLLAGEHDHRARPWLKARMPAFPARAELLALGLSHEHGFAAHEDDRPAPDAKLAAVGEKLIEQQGGFNCVMCHAVGKRAAVAPFEAPGINLLDAAVRLRHNYYPRWMIDPPHVDITTRMPKFSQDGKTTPISEVLGGDAFRQCEAVWHYMQTLPKQGRQN